MQRSARRNRLAKADDSNSEAFHGPFKVIQAMLSQLDKFPEDRKKKIEEGILADLLGDDEVPVPHSQVPICYRKFLYATLALYQSHGRYDDFSILLSRYPWKGVLSRKSHLSIAVGAILNEAYLFEERLKKYFSATKSCAGSLGVEFPNRQASHILRSYHRVFEALLKARGIHVHQEDFEPRDLKRIGLLELFAGANEFQVLRKVVPLAIADFRRTWLRSNESAQEATKNVMIISFEVTKPIWTAIGRKFSDDTFL